MTRTALTPHAESAPAAVAGELLAATHAALAKLPDRERLLVAAWLVPLRSARTRYSIGTAGACRVHYMLLRR
jgi:hypothetical protein